MIGDIPHKPKTTGICMSSISKPPISVFASQMERIVSKAEEMDGQQLRSFARQLAGFVQQQ
ncbi:hypothetical protein [Arthrobacter crystallopoietes]|uniref:hypothetical protein n=1 Tax=Crystallibacter crystallopoietes TaxID=37928 RepID=UPI00148675FD|nr:hypothetical protein [Arthrobacter crystallopoietes]